MVRSWWMSLDENSGYRNFHFNGFILRDASLRDAPQDEVSDPHGEEHDNAVRLEPCGHGGRGHIPPKRNDAPMERHHTASADLGEIAVDKAFLHAFHLTPIDALGTGIVAIGQELRLDCLRQFNLTCWA